MSFSAKIILDSVSKAGKRLTTFELTYPRFIHSQVLTHRLFSRNSASSRAIPTKKMLEMVDSDPAMPIYWGKNKKGMSASKEINDISSAKAYWLAARNNAVFWAKQLYSLGVHKQIVNRIVEPWKFITIICTATEWSNFYSLRRHDDAQPEMQLLANLMYDAQEKSIPVERIWHIPYIQEDEKDLPLDTKCRISVARCARVSYLTHNGKRDIEKDLSLYDRLLTGSGFGHFSPFEPVAKASDNPDERSGNFVGWIQYRKLFAGECQ